MKNKKLKHYTLNLDSEVISEVDKFREYNLSKLVRKLLKKYLKSENAKKE